MPKTKEEIWKIEELKVVLEDFKQGVQRHLDRMIERQTLYPLENHVEDIEGAKKQIKSAERQKTKMNKQLET